MWKKNLKIVLRTRFNLRGSQDPLYKEWIMNAMGNIWEPLLVGTMTIGILSSIAGYYIMHFLWRLHAYRRLKKRGK